MIPEAWRPVRRGDGELVGYLEGEVPRTLVGSVLPTEHGETGEQALVERGLTVLDRRWWAQLPDTVVAGVDAADPAPGWPWRPVVVVEARPDACRIRLEFAPPSELRLLTLPVPVGDLLRTAQPAPR